MLKRAVAEGMVRLRAHHPATADELEVLHLSPETPHFNDSSYFYGRGGDGMALVTRLSVRTGAPCEVWVSVRAPGQAIAAIPALHHPRQEGWAAGGARWEVVRPGKELRVTYRGPLLRAGERLDADLDLTFHGDGPLIDFAQGVHPSTTARAIAAEPWSRSFFEKLGEIRTVHYEQVGRVVGTVRLGDDIHPVDLRSVRDHSFGRRQWHTWSRHLWFSAVREDGVAFTAACIRYDFVGPLTAGFFIDGVAHPVAHVTPFDELGPPGVIPPTFRFEVVRVDGQRHAIEVVVDGVFPFDMDDGAYAIREAIAKVTVDGVPAVGICEFGWNPRG